MEVDNKDNKTSKNPYAAFNGCCLRKGAQEEWKVGQYNENPLIIIRYADVLLMYAKSLIELDRIDDSVLNAINDVRARAYGVKRDDTGSYPAVTTKDQTELRRVLRRERRVEFAWEGRRFFDLKRWGWLEKAYSHHYYGLLNAQNIETWRTATGSGHTPTSTRTDSLTSQKWKMRNSLSDTVCTSTTLNASSSLFRTQRC